MKPDHLPRILLVEDDPTARAFLTAAATALPAAVDSADSMAAAFDHACGGGYDLWLFDANLPDGNGAELLAQLRDRQLATPAVAHTASDDRAALDALIDAGFVEVLVKPLPARTVRSAIQRVLGLAPARAVAEAPAIYAGKLPVWDDEAAALALNGNRAHIATLRQLFLAELPPSRARIIAAGREHRTDALQAELHKLRASCGFVGAARLGAVALALGQQPESTTLLAHFDAAAQDTLDHAAPDQSELSSG